MGFWGSLDRRHAIIAAAAISITGLLILGVIVTAATDWRPWLFDDRCRASIGDRTVSLTTDEGARAGKIAGTAVGNGDPIARTTDTIADELDLSSEDARVLASTLTGRTHHAFTCSIDTDAPEVSDELNRRGLVARAQRVLDDFNATYGKLPVGGFAPGGVTTGHIEGSAHYEGRAIDFFFRPINDANRTRGWSLAQYAVSQAKRLKIQIVIYDAMIWNADRSSEGWRHYEAPDRAGDRAILEHRDHVHVDVYD